MTHGEGWDFLQLGKYLERADSTSRVLDIKYHILLPTGERVGGHVDVTQWLAVLRSCSAMEAYLKVSEGTVDAWHVAKFLVLHDTFPRSLRFCADQLDRALHRVSGCRRRALHQRARASLRHASVEHRLHDDRRDLPDWAAPVPRSDATAPDRNRRGVDEDVFLLAGGIARAVRSNFAAIFCVGEGRHSGSGCIDQYSRNAEIIRPATHSALKINGYKITLEQLYLNRGRKLWCANPEWDATACV